MFFGAHLRSEIKADCPIKAEEQMVSSDLPQVEDGWRDQLSNDKVRIIVQFPELPMGVVYLFSQTNGRKLQITNAY